MVTLLYTIIAQSLGFNTLSYTVLMHMLIRTFCIYFLGITLARFNKKMLGIRTPFNFILSVMWGSIFASAVIDEQLFLPIAATVLFLMLLSRLLAMCSFHFRAFETFFKGTSSVLVKNGTIEWEAMKQHFITERELLNELQSQLHTDSLKNIESATLASDGTINFITKNQK